MKRFLFSAMLLASTSFATTDRSDIAQRFDIPYISGVLDPDDRHKLDLYLPTEIPNAPILVWIHGGAWAVGDRKDASEFAGQLAKKGIAVASIGYRLSAGPLEGSDPSSAVKHPDHIRDCAKAIAWLVANAEAFGYDARNVFICGYSSGGHLAALLAMDPSYLAAEGVDLAQIRGVIPISGAYDLASYRAEIRAANGEAFAAAHVDQAFGSSPQDWKDASPASYVSNIQLPMLVLSDGALARYTEVFETACKATHAQNVSFVYYPKHDHSSLFEALGSEDSPARDRIIDFIAQHARS